MFYKNKFKSVWDIFDLLKNNRKCWVFKLAIILDLFLKIISPATLSCLPAGRFTASFFLKKGG